MNIDITKDEYETIREALAVSWYIYKDEGKKTKMSKVSKLEDNLIVQYQKED